MECITKGTVVHGHVEAIELTGEEIRSLYAVLQQVPDQRCRRGRRYEAVTVVVLLLLAKLTGERQRPSFCLSPPTCETTSEPRR